MSSFKPSWFDFTAEFTNSSDKNYPGPDIYLFIIIDSLLLYLAIPDSLLRLSLIYRPECFLSISGYIASPSCCVKDCI